MIKDINSVVIIGSGNVASQIARQLLLHNINIKQVYSRNITTAKALADDMHTSFTSELVSMDVTADLYLLAVNDDSIMDIAETFPFRLSQNQFIAHTSGATPSALLCNVHFNYGCIWPILSINQQEQSYWSGVPFAITGANNDTKKLLHQLMDKISNNVFLLNDDDKTKLHLAATIVNNFSNHLYALTEDYCIKNELDFKKLVPMLSQQVAKLNDISPNLTQTGSAARHDYKTIDKHVALLENESELSALYKIITSQIINKSK